MKAGIWSRPKVSWTRIGLGFLILLGAALRLGGLGLRGIWFDEGYTAALARLSYGGICEKLQYDSGPPLMYFIVSTFPATDQGEFWLRLPGVLFSIAALPLVFLVGRRIGGAGVGLFALFLTAISPLQIHYAQEARFYPFLTFFAVLACFGILKLIEQRSKLGLALYLFSALALVYLHNVGIFFVLCCLLVSLWRVRDRDLRLYLVIGHAVIGLIYLAWVPILLQQMSGTSRVIEWMQRFWEGYPPALALFRTFEAYSFAPQTPGFVGLNHWPRIAPAFAVLWIVLIGLGVADREMRRRGLLVTVLIPVGFLLFLYIYSFRQPIYLVGRTDSFLFPLFGIGIAGGLERLRRKWRGTAVVLPVLLAFFSGMTLAREHYVPPGFADREAAAWLVSVIEPPDLVILCGPTALTLDYYLSQDIPHVPRRHFPLRLERELSTMRFEASRRQAERVAEDALYLERIAIEHAARGGTLWIVGIEHSMGYSLMQFFKERGWMEVEERLGYRTGRQNHRAVIFGFRRENSSKANQG